MQVVIGRHWSLDVRPSKRTKYTPAQNVRLTNVALSASLKDESATGRTSLTASAHEVGDWLTQFIFEVVGHNDLSLSGYEFYDNLVTGIWPDNPREINNGDRLGTAGRNTAGEKPADLAIQDKVHGTGPPVEKTSIAHFFYIVLKMDGRIIDRNDKGGVPAMINMNDTKHAMPALAFGLMGMCTGGQRRLYVPPRLGMGKTPIGGIGPDESFFLYLWLVSVESGMEAL